MRLDPGNPLTFAAVMLFTLVVCIVGGTSAPITIAVVACVGAGMLYAGNLKTADRDQR